MPERGPGEALDPGRGRRHLRQRPEVLPRRGEVLGRREPAGLGRDRRDPRPRVRSARSSSSTTRPRSGGASPSATGWCPSRSCRAGNAATASAASTTCASPTTSTASSGATPAAMASYMVYPAEALVHKITERHPAAPRRVRRAAVLRPARRRARQHHLRGHRRRRGLRSDRPRHDRGRRAPSTRRRSSPSTWRRTSSSWPQAAAPTSRSTSPSRTPVAVIKDLTDGYGADVYLEGTGHPVRGSPGPQPATQARPVRRVRRLRQRRLRRLEHHQRRQGARRPRRPSRPVLLARGDQDDRVRRAADGQDLHATSCR